MCRVVRYGSVFFFNDTATTEIYTLSLHDALPICEARRIGGDGGRRARPLPHRRQERPLPQPALGRAAAARRRRARRHPRPAPRSEEHTSELQSRQYLVCRLLLEKKKRLVILTTDI